MGERTERWSGRRVFYVLADVSGLLLKYSEALTRANEFGTWIMYGVSEDDSECIHSVKKVIEHINEIGFLPLFKNDIPVFPLEERTIREHWWSGDPNRDPMEWRKIIARSGLEKQCVMKEMTNHEIKQFLKSHREQKISAASLEYCSFKYNFFDEKVLDVMGPLNLTDDDLKMASLIEKASSGDEFIRLMRKQLCGLNRYNLRQKLLANEDLVMPLIKAKALKNKQDLFIENALYFFLRCKSNVSDWIIENYSRFQSEYLKSMFCLVLGFRGGKELIPFLIKESENYEFNFPDESYDQAPFLAVRELVSRFMN